MPIDPRLSRLQVIAQDPTRHEELVEALEHPELATRSMAIALAARHFPPHALVPLLRSESNATQRSAARSVLKRQAPASFVVARQLLSDSDPDVVIIALEVLAADCSPEAFLLVQALTSHEDTNIAVAAIEGLGNFEAASALSPLLHLVSSDTWRKMAAISALGKLGSEEAVPPLVACLRDRQLRETCLSALSAIGTVQAFAAVVGLVTSCENERVLARTLRELAAIFDRLPELDPAIKTLSDHINGDLLARTATLTSADDPRTRAAALLVVSLLRPHEWLERAVADLTLRSMTGRARNALALLAGEHRSLLLASADAVCRAALLELAPAAPLEHELVALLQDPDAGVRAEACVLLGERGHTQAAGRIVELLIGAASAQERERIAGAIRRLGDGATPAVRAALASCPSEEPLAVLLSCATPSTLTFVSSDLHGWSRSAHAGLRLQAVAAAAQLPGHDAQQIVMAALGDSDPSVSARAAQALAKQGRIDELFSTLQKPSLSRFRIISALALPGLDGAVAPLVELFSLADPHERVEIVATLGRIGSQASLAFLRSRVRDEHPAIRRTTAEALAAQAAAQDEDELLALSADPEWSVRRWAVEGLTRIDTARASEALAELTRDVDDSVSDAARSALRDRARPPR